MSIAPLTADEYHADPSPGVSLSSSIANILLEQSPRHAWLAHPKLNPNFVRETDSRFDLGSAAHLMLLERREDAIVRVEANDWRTKAAQEARDIAQAAGKYAVLERHYQDVVAMCAAAHDFLAESELSDILDTGIAEHTLTWQEKGRWYRCRPDLLADDHRVVLDYKSTQNAAPEVVSKQIGRMGYDLQAEFYCHGVDVVCGVEPAFVFLFQEIMPPYACSLISLSNAYRAIGQGKVHRAVQIWAQCLDSNLWPAYTNQIHYVEPKPWDLTQFEGTL